jgi:hypothetical protein
MRWLSARFWWRVARVTDSCARHTLCSYVTLKDIYAWAGEEAGIDSAEGSLLIGAALQLVAPTKPGRLTAVRWLAQSPHEGDDSHTNTKSRRNSSCFSTVSQL